MDFCIECGQKKENHEQKFCVNCGASLSKEVNQGSGELQSHHHVTENANIEPVKIKKAMTKKQKKNLVISSIILIVFMMVYFIGDYFTSESRLISKYSDAVSEEDAVKLGEIISFSNSEEKIGENNAKAFLSLLNDSPSRRQEVLGDLQLQSNLIQEVTANEWMTDEYIVSLVKGNGFLFYDTYELVMEPIYVMLHTNVEDAKLFIDDEEVITSDSMDFSHEYGPIVTGNYIFRAEIDNEYVELETVEEATITSWENLSSIYLTMDATYIEFDVEDLGELDARLLINDEVVEVNFLEEGVFGPIIAEETKVSAEVDFPWGSMISEADYPYQHYQLNFSLSEDMQTDVAQAIISFHQSYWEGWQKNSTSEFVGLSDDLMNSIANEFSYYHSDDYYTYERQSVIGEMDKQNIEISYDGEEYRLFVNVMEEYQEDSYYDLDYKNLSDRTNYYQFELRYDDGWKVYDLYDSYSYSIDDPLKIEFSDDLYVISGESQTDEEEEDAEDTNSDSDSGVEAAALNYIEHLVEAINTGDYGLVEPYIKDGSALHGMQEDLVDRLFKNGTTQEIVDASVEKISDNESDWTVTTNETIKIIYESGKEETKSYVWNYTVVAEDSGFVLTDIESVE